MFSSSTFKEVSSTTSLYQHQSSYDLNQFLIDNSTASYGVDSFDLSLLSSDYAFDNYQGTQIKCENDIDDSNNLALSIEIDNCYQYPTQSQLKQEDNLDWQQQYYLQSSSLLSPISPATTAHSSPSPCPSVEYTATIIKQEQNILLPPSPPDSNGVPSPQSIHCESYKIEQFDEQSYVNQTILSPNCADNTIDIKFLLGSREQKQQDHQVLREFLQDTTFQRKHNLKPLALESLFGGLTQQGDIEPVISLALQHAKQEVQATCNALKISPDPQQWTSGDVQLWICSTIKQFKLEPIVKCELLFPENGQLFAMLNDEDFIQRVPQIGSILHAQLEIWKAAYVDSSHIDSNMLASSNAGPSSSGAAVLSMNSALSQTSLWNQMLDDDQSDISDEEEAEKPMEVDSSSPKSLDSVKDGETLATAAAVVAKTKTPKKHHSHLQKKGTQSSHIHLWQFLKELLASPQSNGTAIRWLDRSKGIFKIEDSVRVARLWGRRKNRPAMNYDKLSRSIRQYYKKGIMKKTERSQRLVYQFCHPYSL